MVYTHGLCTCGYISVCIFRTNALFVLLCVIIEDSRGNQTMKQTRCFMLVLKWVGMRLQTHVFAVYQIGHTLLFFIHSSLSVRMTGDA